MAIETTRFDIAEELDSPEAIAIYLNDAMEAGYERYLTHAINNVARARGMSDLAAKTGISRGGLYKALSENGNPSFATIAAILKALGVRLSVAAQA